MPSTGRAASWVSVVSYPNVNAYASTPGSRKVICSVRSRTVSCSRTSWYMRPPCSTPVPSSSTSTPCEGPGGSPSRSTRNAIGSGSSTPTPGARRARGTGRRSTRRPGRGRPARCRPSTLPSRAQWLSGRHAGSAYTLPRSWDAVGRGEVLAAAVAEVGLGCEQVCPVGRRLDPGPLDRDEVARDAEQPLEGPLRALVASFPEVLAADGAVGVDEVQRRPVVVVEGVPDLVVVVGRDRVLDRPVLDGVLHQLEVVLEGELRGVDPDDHQSVVAVGICPGPDVGKLCAAS